MLPVQLVAVACIGAVYNWFIAHPSVAKKVAPAKRLLISASKRAARRVRELLDSTSRLRLQNLDPWRPAPSPPATLTTALPVHALDVALPSPPPLLSIPQLNLASPPQPSPSLPLLDFPFSSRSPVPALHKRFRAPSLSAVPQPRCFAIERNITSHSQQCLAVDRLSPHAISAAPSSWSVHVRVEYSPLLCAFVVLCVVVLPCLAAIYLVFVRLTRRMRRYSRKVSCACLPNVRRFAHSRSRVSHLRRRIRWPTARLSKSKQRVPVVSSKRAIAFVSFLDFRISMI